MTINIKKSKQDHLFLDFLDEISPSMVITTVCVFVLTLFTFLYTNKDKLGSITIISISLSTGVIIIALMLTVIITKMRFQKERELKDSVYQCMSCANDLEKNLFSDYELVTYEQLIAYEAELMKRSDSEKCKVYNYTTLDDTVDGKKRDIIKNNMERGVCYKILYTDVAFSANSRNIDLYGAENLIHYTGKQLYNTSSFDILLYITPDGTDGYATVNFKLTSSDHDTCAYKKDCKKNRDNSNILYKHLPSNITRSIEKQFNKFFSKKVNENE